MGSTISAPRRRRFLNENLAQTGTKRLQPFPEPARQIFQRRVFQPLHLIEVVVIEHRDQRRHRPADLPMLINPPHRRVDLAFDRNHHTEAMPVNPRALMARRYVRQCMGSFKMKLFGKATNHLTVNFATAPIRVKTPFGNHRFSPLSSRGCVNCLARGKLVR